MPKYLGNAKTEDSIATYEVVNELVKKLTGLEGALNHNDLIDRNSPGAHSIEAIEGVESKVQELVKTEVQKLDIDNKISTAVNEKYTLPSDGIPKTDLSSEVQTSLNKADSAVQSLSGYATETYVNNAVAGIVDSAPEALNTLNELAAALGNNENFATTVSETIGKKQDSPTVAIDLPSSGTALSDNTIYTTSAAVGTYNFVAPTSGWAHGTFTTDANVDITVSDAKYLGEAPTFSASTQYEFDVLNGVWIFAEVVQQ